MLLVGGSFPLVLAWNGKDGIEVECCVFLWDCLDATRIVITVISLRCSVRMSRKPSRALLTDDFPRASESNVIADVNGPW